MLCGKFREIPFTGVVAVGAVIVTAIGDGKVHAVGGRGTRAERHDGFQVELVDGADAIGAEQLRKLKAEGREVAARLGKFYAIVLRNGS